ncbi:hypothetical protein [Massilia antarctica]|uniref:hypothetical protein n=1 Tax=Massilia antarctica TaxID=2765360 RepID=UPI0006BB951E|nr:hypothetical protein [Massilia sp. H27-R4]MCY0916127.1 hypothetical protein [Massilia sp. H27-R4]
MQAFPHDHEITPVFAAPWAYPGLPVRLATSCCLTFEERHHLVWSSWSIFNDGQQAYARRIEWPCMMGSDNQTGEFARTFAAESMIDRQLADVLIEEAMAAVNLKLPTDADACAIDGGDRSLCFWHEGAQKSLNWPSSARDSSLDLWFERAATALEARLPPSHAHASYHTRPDEISSSEASNPRLA